MELPYEINFNGVELTAVETSKVGPGGFPSCDGCFFLMHDPDTGEDMPVCDHPFNFCGDYSVPVIWHSPRRVDQEHVSSIVAKLQGTPGIELRGWCVAVDAENGCKGCVAEFNQCEDLPKCDPITRKDGRNIIWMKLHG